MQIIIYEYLDKNVFQIFLVSWNTEPYSMHFHPKELKKVEDLAYRIRLSFKIFVYDIFPRRMEPNIATENEVQICS